MNFLQASKFKLSLGPCSLHSYPKSPILAISVLGYLFSKYLIKGTEPPPNLLANPFPKPI